MKLKKLIAAVAAAAVAVSAMAVNAFAYEVKKGDTGNYEVVIKGENGWCSVTGRDVSEVYGITYHVTFSEDVLSSWAGGAIGTSSTANSWNTQEWGTDTSKPVKADTENGTITVLYDKAPITDSDEYGLFALQVYDNNPGVTVVSADILGKGGTVLSDEPVSAETTAAAAEEAAPAEDEAEADAGVVEEEVDESGEDEAPAEEAPAPEEEAPAEAAPAETAAQTTAAAADSSTPSAGTGNVPAIALVSIMALAGTAAAVTKKRK